MFDELKIENNKVIVIRRIGVNEDLSLYILENETIEELRQLVIPTFKTNTYLYIKEHENLQYHAKYLIDNEYAEQFATKAELSSEINQTASGIMLEVNLKLDEAELGTQIIQNYESVKIAWNNISEYIQFKDAKLQILDEDKKILMSLDKTGQHFYDASEGLIGDVGIIKYNDVDMIAFNLNVTETTDSGMAWGIQKGDKFYPIFYTQGTYSDDSSEYGGSLVCVGDFQVAGMLAQDISVYGTFAVGEQLSLYLGLDSSKNLAGIIDGDNILFAKTPKIRNYVSDTSYYEGYPMVGTNTNNKFLCQYSGDDIFFYVDDEIIGSLSDRRLKEDVKEIDDKLVMAVGELKIYQFRLLNSKDKISVGIIAQELIEIFDKYGIHANNYSILRKAKYKIDDETEYFIIEYNQFLLLRQLYVEKLVKEGKNG